MNLVADGAYVYQKPSFVQVLSVRHFRKPTQNAALVAEGTKEPPLGSHIHPGWSWDQPWWHHAYAGVHRLLPAEP